MAYLGRDGKGSYNSYYRYKRINEDDLPYFIFKKPDPKDPNCLDYYMKPKDIWGK